MNPASYPAAFSRIPRKSCRSRSCHHAAAAPSRRFAGFRFCQSAPGVSKPAAAFSLVHPPPPPAPIFAFVKIELVEPKKTVSNKPFT